MGRDGSPPILMRWSGDEFQPLDRFRKRCDEQYVVGEVYTIEAQLPRSEASHSHYFACIQQAWRNLPESDDRFPTPEHLRKHALIHCGYTDKKHLTCSSNAQARAVAAFMGPVDDYAVIDIKGPTITVYTAKSQSLRSMGKADFQESKDAVLGFLSEMIGVDVTSLLKASA
jgi:hypothetical protein